MEKNYKTILYVDDDADDREMFSDILKEINPEVKIIEAENGDVALKYLNIINEKNELLPCLIVLDLNMPVMDGRETFKRIKSNPLLKNVPLVVFTSSLNPHDKIEFEKEGIELISKPDDLSYFNKIATRMLVMCSKL